MPQHVMDDSLYAEEIELERQSVEMGVADYRRRSREYEQKGRGALLTSSKRLMVHWFRPLCRLISAEKAACTAGKHGLGRHVYGPILKDLDTEKMAVATMHVVVGAMLADPLGTKVTPVVLAIGRSVNAQVNWEHIRREAHKDDPGGAEKEIWNDLTHLYRRQPPPRAINRVSNRYEKGMRWPLRLQCHLGSMLLDKLLRVATCDSYDRKIKPAFQHMIQRIGIRTVGMIRPTEVFLDRIEESHLARQYLKPRYMPMIIPPLPWTGEDAGGFLRLEFPLVKRSVGRRDSGADTNETIMEAINALNSVPLRINRRILEVMRELWISGGNAAGLPRLSDLPMPPKPADYRRKDVKAEWKKLYGAWKKANAINQAMRLIFLRKLGIAEMFRDRERMYFPHQSDGRLRVYPIPLFLNFQGDDVCRGLLEFAEAKSVDSERARFWLKVHAANCCGIDRVSFDDRIAWVDGSRDTLAGWASDPLENTGWMEADKPWQALAAAIALSDPVAAEHLPVQVDGSNNALQHYAAMLRCPDTARLVNLIPSQTPDDMYARVAEEVSCMVAVDADLDVELGKALEGWITRKVIKQTAMTTTYGVTQVGARRQLYEHLSEAGFGKEHLYEASKYLGNLTIEASGRICPAAKEAMDWIRSCARAIAKSKQLVRWRNPLNVTLLQDYYTTSKVTVSTILQSITYAEITDKCPPSVFKQTNGAPPNIVHSIDSAHMMATAICCRDEGIRLLTVHDCYASHAVDMDRLGTLLREQFVCIHEQPYLKVLAGQWAEMYPDVELPAPPPTGEFNITDVLESPYAFS